MWRLKDGFLNDDGFPFAHFVTTRILGDMKEPAAREKACSLAGLDPASVVYAEQVHGSAIFRAAAGDCGRTVKAVDGLITAEKGVTLAVFTADCLPVLMGAERKALAAVHAGWRGVHKGILPEAVRYFERELDIAPEELHVAIGPHICAGCYGIGDEVRRALALPDGTLSLDLSAEAVSQLKRSGVKQISVSGSCTKHEPEHFYSFRRDKSGARMMTLAAL